MKAASPESTDYEGRHGSLDRRTQDRYRLRMPVSGHIVGKYSSVITGETIDISGRGISFTLREPLPVNAQVELHIQWPVRSPRGERLELSILATVLRSTRVMAAGRIWRHALQEVPLSGGKAGGE